MIAGKVDDMTDRTAGATADGILFRPATEVADLLRRGDISSRELTELLLTRIAAVNPALNAVAELRRGRGAAEAAAAADQAIARGAPGPLLGVPMTVKDSFNVARPAHHLGQSGSSGTIVADRDATLVRRLKRAGAIIIGKTNVAFMLADFGQTANDLYGVTRNPWDTARAPRRLDRRRGSRARRRDDVPVSTAPTWSAPSACRRASAASTGSSRARGSSR